MMVNLSWKLSALIILQFAFPAKSLTYVSDLPTPSFLIDIDMLHKAHPKSDYPHLYLPKTKSKLFPYSLDKNLENDMLESVWNSKDTFDISQYEGQSALGYIHSSVIRSRRDGTDGENPDTFLAELDLEPSIYPDAHLVMGINNHHVGSYYWARSAGMGASMEAPGISFRASTLLSDGKKRGILCWEGSGPLDCNSNDGKRSEWVNFVKKGDLVQLLPACLEDGLLAFVGPAKSPDLGIAEDFGVFGFSSKGRPLGSEPIIVCRWLLEQ